MCAMQVLERHHCSEAFKVLMQEQNNILSALTDEQYVKSGGNTIPKLRALVYVSYFIVVRSLVCFAALIPFPTCMIPSAFLLGHPVLSSNHAHDASRRVYVRKAIIHLVIATDFGDHFNHVKEYQTRRQGARCTALDLLDNFIETCCARAENTLRCGSAISLSLS